MINGVGSGMNQRGTGNHVHHVTECIHEHNVKKKDGGAAGLRDSVTLQSTQTIQSKQEPQWNLFQWMGQKLGNGVSGIRNLFGVGQGEKAENVTDTTSAKSAELAQLMPREDAMTDRAARYFVTAQEDRQPNNWYQNLHQRMKIKFGSIRNSLTKHLKQDQSLQMGTGKKGTLPKQEKENRSRLSVYKKDELEIDCIITDDSYLLDSYNNKGDYSKLASKD